MLHPLLGEYSLLEERRKGGGGRAKGAPSREKEAHASEKPPSPRRGTKRGRETRTHHPLLLPGQERKESIQLRKEIAERAGLSYRTVGRYLDAWREKGFEGLKLKPPWNRGKATWMNG